MIKVFDNQKSYDDYIDYINSQRGQILGNSRQDPRKFKFNTPKDSYIYSNSNYSKNDSIEFSVLDDINAVLDTAIEDNKYLQFTITPTNKMSNGPSKINGNTLVFIQDTVTLSMSLADKIVRPESGKNYNYDWEIGAGATEIAKINSDSIVTLFYAKQVNMKFH